jgi:ABC-type uncharacterized transport system ATPase subunit
MAPLLDMRAISKSFPGVQALDRVDLALDQGEVLGLVGENGAGKQGFRTKNSVATVCLRRRDVMLDPS